MMRNNNNEMQLQQHRQLQYCIVCRNLEDASGFDTYGYRYDSDGEIEDFVACAKCCGKSPGNTAIHSWA